VRQHHLAECVNAILFSPAFRKDATGTRDSSHCLLDPRELAEWMWRMKLQPALDFSCTIYLGPGVKGSLKDY